MPNDIGLNVVTGDLDIVGLDLYVIKGADRIRQQLQVKLKLWTGEWFLDTEFGTPYLESILGKQVSLAGAVAALKRSIMEVADVKSITLFKYEFLREARTLNVDFEVNTDYGLIRVQA